jgi:DNA-binding beta-propeller fold protein YncE
MSVFTAVAVCIVFVSCASRPEAGGDVVPAAGVTPTGVFAGVGAMRLGDPVAVAVDFNGRAVIADASPGRIIRWDGALEAQEFQQPLGGGLYPSDVAVRGFFVYAVDEAARTILRFDDTGAYRDVLLNFEKISPGRRVSPYSMAVDESGRFAVTDVENHQVLCFDNYLSLETVFGNYGSFGGQLDTPLGVDFSRSGDIVVADTGNRRVQVFTDGGALARIVPRAGASNPLSRPRRAVLDEDGRVYVADPAAGGVFVFDADGALERSFAPAGARGFAPTDVTRSRTGALFVTDETSRTLYVFKGI